MNEHARRFELLECVSYSSARREASVYYPRTSAVVRHVYDPSIGAPPFSSVGSVRTYNHDYLAISEVHDETILVGNPARLDVYEGAELKKTLPIPERWVVHSFLFGSRVIISNGDETTYLNVATGFSAAFPSLSVINSSDCEESPPGFLRCPEWSETVEVFRLCSLSEEPGKMGQFLYAPAYCGNIDCNDDERQTWCDSTEYRRTSFLNFLAKDGRLMRWYPTNGDVTTSPYSYGGAVVMRETGDHDGHPAIHAVDDRYVLLVPTSGCSLIVDFHTGEVAEIDLSTHRGFLGCLDSTGEKLLMFYAANLASSKRGRAMTVFCDLKGEVVKIEDGDEKNPAASGLVSRRKGLTRISRRRSGTVLRMPLLQSSRWLDGRVRTFYTRAEQELVRTMTSELLAGLLCRDLVSLTYRYL